MRMGNSVSIVVRRRIKQFMISFIIRMKDGGEVGLVMGCLFFLERGSRQRKVITSKSVRKK